MNIPELFYTNDPNTFFLIIICLSSICMILLLLIIFQIYFMSTLKNTVNNLTSQNKRVFSDLEEILKATSIVISRMEENLKEFNNQKKNTEIFLNEFKTEITRIADGISGQDTMTKAIELARRGANIADIVSSTGISKAEAEALIKFHKN